MHLSKMRFFKVEIEFEHNDEERSHLKKSFCRTKWLGIFSIKTTSKLAFLFCSFLKSIEYFIYAIIKTTKESKRAREITLWYKRDKKKLAMRLHAVLLGKNKLSPLSYLQQPWQVISYSHSHYTIKHQSSTGICSMTASTSCH